MLSLISSEKNTCGLRKVSTWYFLATIFICSSFIHFTDKGRGEGWNSSIMRLESSSSVIKLAINFEKKTRQRLMVIKYIILVINYNSQHFIMNIRVVCRLLISDIICNLFLALLFKKSKIYYKTVLFCFSSFFSAYLIIQSSI